MTGLKFLKLDARQCSFLLGIAMICGLGKEWAVAALIIPPMVGMVVDFCKYRPPVQYHVPTAQRLEPPAAAEYIGPKLIQGPRG